MIARLRHPGCATQGSTSLGPQHPQLAGTPPTVTWEQALAALSSAGLVIVGDDLILVVYQNTTGGNDSPVLPPTNRTLIDVYFPGNWMVRGSGTVVPVELMSLSVD